MKRSTCGDGSGRTTKLRTNTLEMLRSVSPADSTPGTRFGRAIAADRTGLTCSSCSGLPAKVTCNRLAADACWPAICLIAHRVDLPVFATKRHVLANRERFGAPRKVIHATNRRGLTLRDLYCVLRLDWLTFVERRPGGACGIASRWTEPLTSTLWAFDDPRPFPRSFHRDGRVGCKHFPRDSWSQRVFRFLGEWRQRGRRRRQCKERAHRGYGKAIIALSYGNAMHCDAVKK